jgi:hypothetical protein
VNIYVLIAILAVSSVLGAGCATVDQFRNGTTTSSDPTSAERAKYEERFDNAVAIEKHCHEVAGDLPSTEKSAVQAVASAVGAFAGFFIPGGSTISTVGGMAVNQGVGMNDALEAPRKKAIYRECLRDQKLKQYGRSGP